MSTYEYVGARYVPIFADPVEWNINRAYEALTIVTYNNDCYTSKIPVPVGTQITNTTYWMNSSNFNTKIAELFSKFPVSIQDGGTGASTAAGARTNLDVAQNDGASITLYDAEQNEADLIAKVGNVNVARDGSLQNQVSTLRNSVDELHVKRVQFPTSGSKTIICTEGYQQFLWFSQRAWAGAVWNANGTIKNNDFVSQAAISFSASGTRNISVSWNQEANLNLVLMSYMPFTVS